jgi:translation initiation factor 1
MPDDRRLVYSTDPTFKIDRAGQKSAAKRRGVSAPSAVPADGVLRVGCERRRGGQVTLIYNLPAAEIDAVAGELKRRCGTGGTIKDGVVALQGDKREAAIAYFAERGRKAKKMGG